MTFLFQPATVLIDAVPQRIAWIVEAPDHDPNLMASGKLLRLWDGNGESITEYQWKENPVRTGHQWVFTDTRGRTIQVRQALPGDAVSTGFAPYSLPMRLLREKSRNPGMDGQYNTLMAAVNPDDNYVLTLVLVSPAGVYARYSQNWFEIASANSLGNCYLVGVMDTAVETYDSYDSRGNQVSIKSLQTIPGWTPPENVAQVQVATEAVTTPAEQPGQPAGVGVVAAGDLVLPTRLDQTEQITAALRAGEVNPDIRWAVQRRLSQLHWEGEFPWN